MTDFVRLRAVLKPRKNYACRSCGRGIYGAHIYLYGRVLGEVAEARYCSKCNREEVDWYGREASEALLKVEAFIAEQEVAGR